MEITMHEMFKDIINIDSKYLIINGAMRSGKFYAACQKIVFKCLTKKTIAVIVSLDYSYPKHILTEILADTKFKFNMSVRCFEIECNGSEIYILHPNSTTFIPFNYALIQGADGLFESVFNRINDRFSFDQIILTCNPPQDEITLDGIIYHWLNKLSKQANCKRINIAFNSIDENPFIPDSAKEYYKQYYK
jgi:hypothetical protein